MNENVINNYTIREGITEKQISQLITYSSNELLVQRFTSDAQRFQNRSAFETWRKKGRSIYTLVNNSSDLIGIVWFGKSAFPKCELLSQFKSLETKNYPFTFAIRLYREARGKGLAKEVTKTALAQFTQTEEYQAVGGGLWLETSHDNIAAIQAYRSLFTLVSHPNKHGKVIMVLENPELTSSLPS